MEQPSGIIRMKLLDRVRSEHPEHAVAGSDYKYDAESKGKRV